MLKNKNDKLEKVIEVMEDFLENNGYDHIRMSEHKTVSTTAYDSIIFKDGENEFTITFNESVSLNKHRNFVSTNFIEHGGLID